MRVHPAAAVLVLSLLVASTAAVPASRQERPKRAVERYALGLIWKGPNAVPGRSAHGDSVQAAHLANNLRMFEAGRLCAAGPCAGDPSLRGLWIWRVDTLAEIPALLAGDPAIQEGRLRVETVRWTADAGIGDTYRAAHQRDPAARDSMGTFAIALLRRGPAGAADDPASARAHEGHLERLRRQGVLVLGGPIEGAGEARGLYVFATDSSRAAQLVAADPAVKAGRFVPQVWSWWTAHGIVPGH